MKKKLLTNADLKYIARELEYATMQRNKEFISNGSTYSLNRVRLSNRIIKKIRDENIN